MTRQRSAIVCRIIWMAGKRQTMNAEICTFLCRVDQKLINKRIASLHDTFYHQPKQVDA